MNYRIASLVMALISSGSAHNASANVPSEGPARLGKTVSVGSLRVTPIHIVEDSRCPENARCVWAGRAVVRATISGGRWSRTMDLTLGEPAPVADGMLSLTGLSPEKRAGRQTKSRDYRFTFAFQGDL